MEIYINYALQMLSNSNMPEKMLHNSLAKKFSLTDAYLEEILSTMIKNNLVTTEFDDDFQNIYSITSKGDEYLCNMFEEKQTDEQDSNIDYKSLLSDLSLNADNDDTNIEEQTDNKQANEDVYADFDIKNKPIYDESEPYLKDFSKFKINVKKHTKTLKYDTKSSQYIKSTKLELFTSIISSILFATILSVIFLIFEKNNFVDNTIALQFLVFGSCYALYPIAALIVFICKPYKKIKNTFNFSQSIKLIVLCAAVALILILALNFLFGLNTHNFLKFVPFWLFPGVLTINIVLYPIIKALLIKTNKFNA